MFSSIDFILCLGYNKYHTNIITGNLCDRFRSHSAARQCRYH
ncbi:hypothetical protein HMPREF6485_0481 [Segatella buccae ATCC 33574]|uniref:Uncharacterized protein n=1 Tax=Segatella buccae ATCC 33574 TaxID=873513 RepID=E6K4H9_9BACT|nr:hypothetical protein HMPREF6485_0481 [Segatella buccae ATCC 33574]